MSFIYGDCEAGDDYGCAAPVEIQVWPACERSIADYDLEGVERQTLLGVPGAKIGPRFEVYTSDSTVVVFTDGRTNASEVASGLLMLPEGALPAEPPDGGASSEAAATSELPEPEEGALSGELSCKGLEDVHR